jgi:cytochrome c-type biogenesis protein
MGELAIAVAAGVGATITPCVLPLYPGFLAYITAPQPLTSPATGISVAARPPPALAAALVWVGVVLGMVVIGAVLAGLSLGLGSVLRVLVPVVDVLLIALGVLLVAGRNPFARLPQLAPTALGRSGPIAGAFLYGLMFAPIALPCSGPFLIGIFVASLTLGDALRQLGFFAAFGVGFGLPLLALGLVGQVRARELAAAAVRWERPLQLVLGTALIAIGAWDLWVNLPQVIG